MAKWIVDATLVNAPSDTKKPQSLSEIFVGDEGAKLFVMKKSREGYSLIVRTHDSVEDQISMDHAEAIRWASGF